MTLPEDLAVQRVSAQRLGSAKQFGSNAPTTLKALLTMLHASEKRGYNSIQDVYASGMSSMAAPVRRKGEPTTGVVITAGPSSRSRAKRMVQLGRRWNGWHGSTTIACSNPLATYLPQKLRQTITGISPVKPPRW